MTWARFGSSLGLFLLFSASACSDDGSERSSGSGGATGSYVGGATNGSGVIGGYTSVGGASSIVGGATSTATAYVEPVETIDLNELPTSVPRVSLEVADSALAQLEAEPFDGPNVTGAFIDASSVRYEPVEVNYRGAYALQSLIRYGEGHRNWKVKFAKDKKYRGKREWNYNFEQHVRQKLTYDLMRFAGVKVPSARHVRLTVNSGVTGAYLEFEDPDNKDWLAEKFGDDSGDLYKAAYDIPNETPYFATLEYLGDNDSDYEKHYRKMTNNDEPTKAFDFSSLRAFLRDLNQTNDSEFEAFLRQRFDIDKFISYLVVGNFVSHWDSYPERPKNFWLYQVLAANRWVFVPWDMDATFQTAKGFLNPMGTDASVFYQFDGFEDYEGRQPEEGTARPLVTKMMRVPAFRAAYVARYREALQTFLATDYLLSRVDALATLIEGEIPNADREGFDDDVADVRRFIQERARNVTAELATVP